jgi:hypothetical protein
MSVKVMALKNLEAKPKDLGKRARALGSNQNVPSSFPFQKETFSLS